MKTFVEQSLGFSVIKPKPSIPLWRTINDCLIYIKSMDSKSAITRYYIEQLCRRGKVLCTTAGKKILVDLNSLIETLKKG